jgi:ABC-type Fe3+-hydroxamate transport system substrate-binding protein
VILTRAPRRVVSLVPSDTYTLFALGCGERVVGRTTYCEAPADGVARIPTCGGTKDVDVEAVMALHPDLVIANQEENSRAPLERLAQSGVTTFVSLPRRVSEGVAHVARVARMLGIGEEESVKRLVRHGYELVRDVGQEAAAAERSVPTFVPIWMDPLMTLNGETFGSDVLAAVGAHNVFGDRARLYPLAADLGKARPHSTEQVVGRDTRYPRITAAEIEARAPSLVLLPDEPHRFSEADAAVFRGQATPAAARGAIVGCSGKDLFWYGAWTIEALPRLQALVAAHAG